VILQEVTLHNFGPYRGRTTVNMAPTGSGERPIVLVGALNGSGKTSLLDAVLLALYGSRARCSTRNTLAYSDFLRECINSRTPADEGALVSISFDYVTSRMRANLRVTRSWKSTGTRIAETLVVERDGRVDEQLSETWPETVESLVPLGISNLFFFDGEQVRAIASSAEPTEEVKGAIRTLLGIDLADQLREDLEIIASRRRRKLLKEPQARREYDEKAEELRAKILVRQELVAQLGIEQNRLAEAEQALTRAKEAFRASGGETGGRATDLRTEVETLRRDASAARDRLRELASGNFPLLLILPLLQRALERAESEVTASQAGALSQLLRQRDEEISAAFAREGFSREAVTALRALQKADRVRRGTPSSAPPVMGASIGDIALVRNGMTEAVERTGASARSALRELDQIERNERRLQATLDVAATEDFVEAGLAQLAVAQQQVSRVQADIEALNTRLADVRREISVLQSTVARLRAESEVDVAVYNEDARVVRAAGRVSAIMEEFRRKLLLRKVHQLENHISERFAHLHRKSGAVHRILIDPETFRLTLFDVDGTPVNRERMSAGEQQLLAVAFLWGLSLASGRSLPVVIDTPLGRMDHTHRRYLIERYFPRASHQVILLSTDAEIDRDYHQTLRKIGAIDREYLLSFDQTVRSTRVSEGYFWSE
jgi:DNA sulfur modification protein DndD